MFELYSSQWLKTKKERIINNDNTFQNASDDTLSYQNIERNPQRITKIKPYISKYNWEGIEFPAGPKEWEKFEQNNKTIGPNILFVLYNKEKIRNANRSKYKKASNFVKDYWW